MNSVYSKLSFLLTLIMCTYINQISAQEVLNEPIQLNWEKQQIDINQGDFRVDDIYTFEKGCREDDFLHIPYLNYLIEVQSPGDLKVYLTELETETLDIDLGEKLDKLKNDYGIKHSVERNGNKYYARINILPAKNTGGSIQGLKKGTIQIILNPTSATAKRGPTNSNSKLSTGTWHKFSINKSGIFRLNAAFIQNEFGINPADIDPKKIKLYGHGGGRLPILAGSYAKDDLPEIPIVVAGEEDNNFDANDYILFYGEGPNKWAFNESENELQFSMNTYSTKNYYFIQFDGNENGQRITQVNEIIGEADIDEYDIVSRQETDQYNVLDYITLNQGSGQEWFGDLFKNLREATYNFNLPNRIPSQPIQLEARFASRSATNDTNFSVEIQEQIKSTSNFAATSLDNSNSVGAYVKTINEEFAVTGSNIEVEVTYPFVQNTTGWLDYIEIRTKGNLTKGNGQLTFHALEALNFNSVNYKINSSASLLIWDITDPCSPKGQPVSDEGSVKSFGANAGEFSQFVAFNTAEAYEDITYEGLVPNQNLHGLDAPDMIIISPQVYMSQAMQLAEHRSNSDDISVSIIQPVQIFNEFSSGKPDAAAIRNFLKLIYEKDPNKLKYVLLLGDGSFDNRNILGLGTNFVITYETESSLSPIYAYPSDDYYGLLDDGEGTITENDLLNVSIGRLPVKTVEEAAGLVNKIIRYDDKKLTQGDWKLRSVFVGDDEDNSKHSKDSDKLAKQMDEKYDWANEEKIYIDAFEQESTSFGTRVPEARAAITNNLFKGALSIIYLGHGGSIGWAQERILQMQDILNFNNTNKLPVFLTATCSFSGYDDPKFTSGGEETILNPDGGAIAMFTTVRAVLANDNYELSRIIVDTLYTTSNEGAMRFGDAILAAKNNPTVSASNHRKFTLLGDPSQQIAIPAYEITTTHINNQAIDQNAPDTLSSLELVTIRGKVNDLNGADLTSFNGQLYISVFDKKVTNQTLGQDSGSPIFSYDIQKNIIFKGRSSITAGQFEFSFVVPKDISFEYGNGKISYYAIESNGNSEAKGSTEQIIIGGSSDNAIVDNEGPEVEVYMNNENFVFGGITGTDPILYVKLRDDNGINIVGNSVGHDLTGTLDENTQNTFLLNDYYESELDTYKEGIIRYPLSNISEGRHEIRVKAWDIANNSSEGYTEFIVSSSGEIALEQVLNYPNPFTNSTCFQFEHNMEGQTMDIQVQIFSISGKLVKTIDTQINSQGSRLGLGDCIRWDGKDDFGSELAKGVYIYKIKAQAQGGTGLISGESDYEKLVILK